MGDRMRRMLLIAIAVAALVASAGASASGGTPVYIATQCDTYAFMPHAVTLACADDNLYVTRLEYKHYGQKTTTATGLFHSNDCTPNCAAGRFHAYTGTIVFRNLVRCKGKLFYALGEYKFAGPNGSGKADVQPVRVHCAKVTG
jgi:hypothetical protein